MSRLMRGLAVMVVGVLGLSAPTAAHADPVVDHWSSVTVTRLTLTGGEGRLTVQVDIRSPAWNGFTVTLPQAYDEPLWTGPADVEIPGTSVDCRREYDGQYWAPMEYHCGMADIYEPAAVLPVGHYSLSIPVSGGIYPWGLTGKVALWSDHLGSVPVDTFPVYDEDGPRTTVEVKVARLRSTTIGWTATVSAELAIAAADRVTDVDVLLPDGPWRLLGTDAPVLGYRASLTPLSTGSSYLLLRYTPAGGASYLPSGTVQLTTRLTIDGPFEPGKDPHGQTSQVRQFWGGGRLAFGIDSFAWRPEY